MDNENNFTPEGSSFEEPSLNHTPDMNDQDTQTTQGSNQYYYDPNHMQHFDGYYQSAPQPEPVRSANGFATASLVLGIAAIVFCCCCYLSIPLGALSIMFAILSRGANTRMPSSSKTGLILSIVGLVLTVLLTLFAVTRAISDVGINGLENQVKDYMEYYMQDELDDDDLNDLKNYFRKDSQNHHSESSPKSLYGDL